MLTIRDFQPFNSWSVPSTPKGFWGQSQETMPKDLVDETTGRVYWYSSEGKTRLICLFAAVTTPLVFSIRMTMDVVALVLNVVSLGFYRAQWNAGKLTLMKCVQEGTKDAIRACGHVMVQPIVGMAMNLFALYGLVRPYDGRKLYSSMDRYWHGEANLSRWFHPGGGRQQTSPGVKSGGYFDSCNKMLLLNWHLGGVVTLLHEGCHWLALKVLFEDVDPSIHWYGLFTRGGYCRLGGPAKILTPLFRGWERNTALACVSAAGPIGEIISLLAGSLSFYCMRHSPNLETKVVVMLATALNFHHMRGLLSYSIFEINPIDPGKFVSNDFQSVANLLEIERIHLVAMTVVCCLIPIYLNVRTLNSVIRGKQLLRY